LTPQGAQQQGKIIKVIRISRGNLQDVPDPRLKEIVIFSTLAGLLIPWRID